MACGKTFIFCSNIQPWIWPSSLWGNWGEQQVNTWQHSCSDIIDEEVSVWVLITTENLLTIHWLQQIKHFQANLQNFRSGFDFFMSPPCQYLISNWKTLMKPIREEKFLLQVLLLLKDLSTQVVTWQGQYPVLSRTAGVFQRMLHTSKGARRVFQE